MNKNPCKGCESAYVKNGKYYKGWHFKCDKCENRIAHEDKLKKKRKYKSGDVITSLDELVKHTWVMVNGVPKHIGFIKSLQLNTALAFLNHGSIKEAILNNEEKEVGNGN